MYLVIFCYWVGPVPYLELFGAGPVEKNTLYFRNFVNMNRKRRGLVFMSALALLAAIGVLALWLGSSGNNDDIGRCLQVSHDQVIKMMND